MDGTPSSVLALGFGSFGSVNLLPTLGFGTVSSPVVSVIANTFGKVTIDRGYISLDEPNAIWWRGLYNSLASGGAGDYVNDATISWIFRLANTDGSYNASGAQPSNSSGSMTYKANSNGDYYGTTPYNAAFTRGSTYWLVATALNSGGAVIGVRKVPYVAGDHGSAK